MSFSLTYPAGSPTQTAGAAPAWPATSAAAVAELARLAQLLTEAGVTNVPATGVLAIPGLAAGPGDTAGIRVRTTGNPPHAVYVIAGGSITPHTGADSAFARLHPLIEAAARPCDGCGAEAGAPCNPHCLPDPTND
ncbi:hypothetical protein OHA84_37915 (plasmid) [Streptomyces sp. NBC_00513]|uniref:hypothetical protein n=1 Tax=unclassified Streptomyces TaxID=2593676 RepID=UPI002250D788|nr:MULTISPECIES: hypothetical protein [unclassified Streptomyces]MCX5078771.1 hypothetical protein [Streptomyces sp. NBC_00424]WUD46308.1 hypothetical protein OHA84_37915 [Streptomyces sp. NBC_00513]